MPQRKPLILVVDDDPGILKLVTLNLELEGYQVVTANDGKTALQLVENEQPSLVILDVMMPVLDGFQVCERIRQFSDVSILMLTARGRSEDIIHGLNIGADDYVVKPFSSDELLARVRAILRRARFPEEMPQPPFTSGELTIDFAQHRVTSGNDEILLTPTEYRILCLLARNVGKAITQDHLLSEVWGQEYCGDTHILQVAVARLRKKIGEEAGKPKYIITRPGIGYVFKKP